MTKAFICGCEGTTLIPQEIEFFAAHQPWGLILFKRNCEERDQMKSLIGQFRDAVSNPDAPVLIDQEGGRVQRLKAPHWRNYPSAATLAEIVRQRDEDFRAVRLAGRLIAHDLYELGITINCAPVLDVSVPGTTSAIGDRSFGSDPRLVEAFGRVFAGGLIEGGILPVMKHIPGHGRATKDSHIGLPEVSEDLKTLAASDFLPFENLADMPMAMVGHVVYSAFDSLNPASCSRTVIENVIRLYIGYRNLLLSDDISMNALSGTLAERAKATQDAGCDMVLYGKGDLAGNIEVANASLTLSGKSEARALKALADKPVPKEFDNEAAYGELQELIAKYAS